MPRMPIQGLPASPLVNPRLRRAFPRIPGAEGVQLNPEDDRMAAILAAFQGMFGEPEMPIQDLSMLRAQQLAARQPVGEYDELASMPNELRGMNPRRRDLRRVMNIKPPGRVKGLRYFGG